MADKLISADALIKALGIAENCEDCQYVDGKFCRRGSAFVDACEAILAAPTIEAKPVKHGRWIEDEYGIPHCSECKAINNTVYRNYCANCGAIMDEAEK